MTRTTLLRTVALLATHLVGADALATTTATLDPMTVPPGVPATLRITTDTGASPQGLERIQGALVQSMGRSTQISVFNGAVRQQATYTYRVIPQGAGTVTIGPLQVGPDRTDPLALRADPNATPSNARRGGGRRAPPQAAAPPTRTKTSVGDRAFLRIWMDDDTPYVGQSVPLTVSAYLRNDIGGTLEGAPKLTAADFVLDGLDEEPTRSETEVNGQTYTRFTWTASLTPVREGSYPLVATLPTTLQWMEEQPLPRRRPSLIDQMFANDPFFRGSGMSSMFSGMGGFVEPKLRTASVELSAKRGAVEVAPPPVEGRPEDFMGAVGTFEIELLDAPTTVSVGEPIELRWSVQGTGNIEGLGMTGIPSGEGYTTYPPESTFDPAVRSGTRGLKTFTQLIVPREPGELQLPELSLPYLDPKTGTYGRVTAPIPTVSVAAVAGAEKVVSGGEIAEPEEAAVAPTGVVRRRLLPWTAQHGVYLMGPFAWILLLFTWFSREPLGKGFRWLWSGASAAWTRQRLLREMRAGVKQEDDERFFRAGQALIRAQLGEEVDERPELGDWVLTFLREADRALYARQPHDAEAMEALYTELLAELKTTETSTDSNHKEAA